MFQVRQPNTPLPELTGAMEMRNLRSFIGALRSPGNLMLLQSVVTATAFRLLHLVFCTFQTVYWQLNGTTKQLRAAHLPENYDRSAQVLDVLLSYELCPIGIKGMNKFICTHNRFESPQYVLDNDHINLMFITDTHAVFCEPICDGMLILY